MGEANDSEFISDGAVASDPDWDRIAKETAAREREEMAAALPVNPVPQLAEEARARVASGETNPVTGKVAGYSGPKGLGALREPFPDHQISQLPKGTKSQNDCPPGDKRNCTVCGGWHHPRIVHLSYVGHAAITNRLLDADPAWYWEPLAFTEEGLPRSDASAGLWIKLTMCGVTRLGYGHAASKSYMDPGAREKEVIGDALRNAAMRFGAALDLWHKGDLHGDQE